jgi:TatD DNase family protein
VAWTDSHAHLTYDGVGLESVARARAAGVARIVCVGTDAVSSAAAVDLVASAGPGIWATVGLHPHDAINGLAGLDELWGRPLVVAVGECGLDYHYDHSPRHRQREMFAAQIGVAHERGLALVVHTREAWDDTFAILASEGVPPRTVVHCFSGGPAEAERSLAAGASLSFSGIVTFKTADDVRAAVARCPLERLLVETDAPFLAPVPHRGKPNEPALVTVVGERVAAVRGVPPAEVEAATWANAEHLFGLSDSGGLGE